MWRGRPIQRRAPTFGHATVKQFQFQSSEYNGGLGLSGEGDCAWSIGRCISSRSMRVKVIVARLMRRDGCYEVSVIAKSVWPIGLPAGNRQTQFTTRSAATWSEYRLGFHRQPSSEGISGGARGIGRDSFGASSPADTQLPEPSFPYASPLGKRTAST